MSVLGPGLEPIATPQCPEPFWPRVKECALRSPGSFSSVGGEMGRTKCSPEQEVDNLDRRASEAKLALYKRTFLVA